MAEGADDAGRGLPGHVEDTVRSLAQLHADHHRNATRHDRVVERTTALLARPLLMVALTIIVAAWVGANLAVPSFGYAPFDPPPFPWLTGAISLASLYMVVLILAAQRRDDQLTQRREQLTLELAMVSEQKTAKIIQLLEEFRRDTPHVHDRPDPQAAAMARSSDPRSVMTAIRETHDEAERVG